MSIAKGRIARFVALAVTFVAVPASADESRAERLFHDGRSLLLEGRFDEACPMLEESQRLEPHVGTLLNLAVCHERQGKIGSAWVEYQKALTAARAEGQGERAALAEQRIAVLEPRVPWLRISSSASDVSIALDGSALARVAWEHELPMDPGAHVVTAERRGEKVFEARVELRERERREVLVSVPESRPPEPGPERLVVEPRPVDPKSPPRPARRWILEPGLFFGYLAGSAAHPSLEDANSVSIHRSSADSQPESCAGCALGETRGSGGPVAGAQLFGGYALSDRLDLGVRLMAAPSIDKGSFWGFGPSIVLHPTESLSLGVWGIFGDATFHGRSTIMAPQGYAASTSEAPSQGQLAGGFGVGAEISMQLFELGGGKVVANAIPFFLQGNGDALCLPLGLAYHYQ